MAVKFFLFFLFEVMKKKKKDDLIGCLLETGIGWLVDCCLESMIALFCLFIFGQCQPKNRLTRSPPPTQIF